MKEHVENMPGGGSMCRHCGGMVDDDGYAMGGDVDGDEGEGEMKETPASEDTGQMDAAVSMRNLAELNRNRKGG